jgi:hypothetical protein
MPEHVPIWAAPTRRPTLANPVVRISLWIFLLATACWALWKWPTIYPHPDIWLGIDLVALALIGILISLRGPVSFLEKIGYVSICILLALLGVKLTFQQSNETSKAQKDLSDTLEHVATSTEETKRITALNTQLQGQLLDQSNTISKLAEESFRTIIGADSFPYVSPQPASYPGPVPLFVWDHGKYMLTGVTLTIHKSNDLNYYVEPIDLGILHPGWGKPLSVALQPKPDAETGRDSFMVDMYTQSDFLTEVIEFRKSKDGKFWANRFWVTEHKFGEHDEKPQPRVKLPPIPKNGSANFTIYDRGQWSDEPRDVKPKEK